MNEPFSKMEITGNQDFYLFTIFFGELYILKLGPRNNKVCVLFRPVPSAISIDCISIKLLS